MSDFHPYAIHFLSVFPMVGVGGRCKACENCRNRRVKCDLLRPKCGRCIKAHLHCGGPRDIVVILYNGYIQPALSSNQRDDPYKPVAGLDQTSMGSLCLVARKELLPQRDDIFAAFTHSKLLPHEDQSVITSGAIALESILALSTTYFGLKQKENKIMQFGLGRYSQALTIVQRALGDENASQSSDILESVMIMTLIEFLVSDREDGWIHHSRGLERLFSMREPDSMTSLPCLLILERTRATILAKLAWKSIPWTFHPGRINSIKIIFDILADCPALEVLRDRMQKDSNEAVRGHTLRTLVTRCTQILHDLGRWKMDWASDASHVCTETVSPPTTPRSTDIPIWTTVVQYSSLYHANAMTSYYGALILVLQRLNNVEPTSPEYITRLEQQHIAGLNICRSVDYHLNKRWDEQGNLNLLFPLRMAYDSVGKTNHAIEIWLREVLDNISTGRRGFWRSAKTLLEIGD